MVFMRVAEAMPGKHVVGPDAQYFFRNAALSLFFTVVNIIITFGSSLF